MPWGTKQPTNRGFGLAGVCANAVAAGSIASKSGSASAPPAPRRTVRREMCFLLTNMVDASPINLTRRLLLTGVGCFHVHLEGGALHDAKHERRESVLAARRVPNDRPHQRHILILDTAAQCVSEQLLRHDADELIGIPHQHVAQTRDAVHVRPVNQSAGCIDWEALVLGAPRADRIKV